MQVPRASWQNLEAALFRYVALSKCELHALQTAEAWFLKASLGSKMTPSDQLGKQTNTPPPAPHPRYQVKSRFVKHHKDPWPWPWFIPHPTGHIANNHSTKYWTGAISTYLAQRRYGDRLLREYCALPMSPKTQQPEAPCKVRLTFTIFTSFYIHQTSVLRTYTMKHLPNIKFLLTPRRCRLTTKGTLEKLRNNLEFQA